MKQIVTFSVILFLFLVGSAGLSSQETLRFQYRAGEQYRILGTINQDVRFNGEYLQTAEMLNRITFQVVEVEEGWGRINAQVQYTQQTQRPGASQSQYQLTETYDSEFWRGPLGEYRIEPQYLMPVVRNVPLFPETALAPGDRWTAQGDEVHDMRLSFGIEEPLRFPMDVHYEYLGTREFEGRDYAEISIRYTIFQPTGYRLPRGQIYPVRISGFSHQNLLFDQERGRPHYYEEEYSLVLSLSDGSQYEFFGDASGRIIEAEEMDRDSLNRELREELDRENLGDVGVQTREDGVALVMENIRFLPNSDELLSSEQEKLRTIARILERYPERNILIEGHAARAGDPEYLQDLSERRAQAVGSFLLELGSREPEEMIYRGFGATRPVAPNTTESGMARNRRVEIIILEN